MPSKIQFDFRISPVPQNCAGNVQFPMPYRYDIRP
jgi:hypothetical protein